MSLTINRNQLVKIAVNAQVDHPRNRGYRGGFDGRARICVGTGGVTYSHAIGDPCMDIAGDHVEPGVSMANAKDGENHAVETLSCVGNEVRILSGEAKGAKGIVTGTHGGIDHTMAWFPPEIIEKLDGTESFLIKAYGQGLKVMETPDVFYMNLDPDLLDLMDLEVDPDATLSLPDVSVSLLHRDVLRSLTENTVSKTKSKRTWTSHRISSGIRIFFCFLRSRQQEKRCSAVYEQHGI